MLKAALRRNACRVPVQLLAAATGRWSLLAELDAQAWRRPGAKAHNRHSVWSTRSTNGSRKTSRFTHLSAQIAALLTWSNGSLPQ